MASPIRGSVLLLMTKTFNSGRYQVSVDETIAVEVRRLNQSTSHRGLEEVAVLVWNNIERLPPFLAFRGVSSRQPDAVTLPLSFNFPLDRVGIDSLSRQVAAPAFGPSPCTPYHRIEQNEAQRVRGTSHYRPPEVFRKVTREHERRLFKIPSGRVKPHDKSKHIAMLKFSLLRSLGPA